MERTNALPAGTKRRRGLEALGLADAGWLQCFQKDL
jgi:hypothetical protein